MKTSCDSMQQLSFALSPAEPYSLRYFVSHSGVSHAFLALEGLVAQALMNPQLFRLVYVYGPRGSGKTHLLQGTYQALLDGGYPKTRLRDFGEMLKSERQISDEEESRFVSTYNELKSSGGFIFVEGASSVEEQNCSSHVKSRLLSSAVFELSYPSEEELEPLITSLLERHNLKITDFAVQYLLRRLPRDPLSFSNIFARLSELSFSESRPAGLGLVRRIVEGTVTNPSENN